MCIYLGNTANLTYETQEHVLPASWGCCTKLEKGVVSDQANTFFSPIERNIIEKSLLQIPKVIMGPGKRGKLSPKYAYTSNVMVVNINNINGLGYMKGESGFLLSQFVIGENQDIQFHMQTGIEKDVNEEIQNLIACIKKMNGEYVPVKMPDDDNKIYVAYYKDKIHIGYRDSLDDKKVNDIKEIFSRNISMGKQKSSSGQMSATLEISHNFKKISMLGIKSAINTLAYIEGREFLSNLKDISQIINDLMTASDAVLNYVSGIDFNVISTLRSKLFIDNNQMACILECSENKITALLFIYEHGFRISLGEIKENTDKVDFILDGIVCDWKSRKDYRYLNYFFEKQKEVTK